MHALTDRRRSERGVVLVIVALGLVALLLFAALAVDYGAAVTQRRKSQNTADAGALGGGQVMLTRDNGVVVTHDEIADVVIDVTWENLVQDASFTQADSMTLAEWRTLFAACTEPEPAGYPVRSTVSDCIRFSAADSRIRVRIPELDTATSFARVVGIDSVTVDAVAEAELVPDGSGGIIPLGLPSASANQAEVCLRRPAPGQEANTGACDDTASPSGDAGFFGSLDITMFGNPVLGTPQKCQGDEQDRIAANIALGVDHPLGEYVLGGTVVNDRDECVGDAELDVRPNEFLGQPGIGSALDDGFLGGLTVDGRTVDGRLTSTPFASLEVRQSTPPIDNRPLWEYIDPSLTVAEVPDDCVRSSYDDVLLTVLDKSDRMARCLDAYRLAASGTYPRLLTADTDGDGAADLLRSPRTAWVPQLHAMTWRDRDPSGLFRIKAFRPIFIQALYFACDTHHACTEHRPGQTGSPFPLNANQTLDAVTAFLLPDAIVPEALLNDGPSSTRPHTLILRK